MSPNEARNRMPKAMAAFEKPMEMAMMTRGWRASIILASMMLIMTYGSTHSVTAIPPFGPKPSYTNAKQTQNRVTLIMFHHDSKPRYASNIELMFAVNIRIGVKYISPAALNARKPGQILGKRI